MASTPRKPVAEHWFIDASGATVDDIELATGIGYRLLALKSDSDPKAGTFEFQIPDAVAGTPLAMGAVFGYKTRAGNESSQARNNVKGAASPDEQLAAVKDAFDYIVANNKWTDGTRETTPVDVPTLAQAYVTAQAADGIVKDLAAVTAKLTADPKLVATVKGHPAVATEYAKLMGRTTKSLADIDAML